MVREPPSTPRDSLLARGLFANFLGEVRVSSIEQQSHHCPELSKLVNDFRFLFEICGGGHQCRGKAGLVEQSVEVGVLPQPCPERVVVSQFGKHAAGDLGRALFTLCDPN